MDAKSYPNETSLRHLGWRVVTACFVAALFSGAVCSYVEARER